MLRLEGPLGDYQPEYQFAHFLQMYPFMSVHGRAEKGPVYSRFRYGQQSTLPDHVVISHSLGRFDQTKYQLTDFDRRDTLLIGSSESIAYGDPSSFTVLANSPYSDSFRVLRENPQLPPEVVLELTRQGLELAVAFNAVYGNSLRGRTEVPGFGDVKNRGRISGAIDRNSGKIIIPNEENLLRTLRFETVTLKKP